MGLKLEAKRYNFKTREHFDADDGLVVASGLELYDEIRQLHADGVLQDRDALSQTTDRWMWDYVHFLSTETQFPTMTLLKMLGYGLSDDQNLYMPACGVSTLPTLMIGSSLANIWNRSKEVLPSDAELSFNTMSYTFASKERQTGSDDGRSIGFPITWTDFSMLSEAPVKLPGPLMISFNHHIMASSEMSKEFKRFSLALELFSYLDTYQALVLGMPSRAAGSLTHELLSEYNPIIKKMSWGDESNKSERTLYFISRKRLSTALLEWYFQHDHPIVAHSANQIQSERQVTSWSDPSTNLFDLQTDWTDEYVEEVSGSSRYAKVLLAILQENQRNLTELLPGWLALREEGILSDFFWHTWIIQQLGKDIPLQLHLALSNEELNNLEENEQKLYYLFSEKM